MVANKMSERNKPIWRKGRGIYKITSGWATWRWLSGVSSKEKAWFLGTLTGRGGYQAWMAHLTKGLQDREFLLLFEKTPDKWEKAKLVGERIAELRKSYLALTDEERAELARQAEVELRTGLEMMGRDKKTIQELIALVDPPKKKQITQPQT
jgi:hypothetical protein